MVGKSEKIIHRYADLIILPPFDCLSYSFGLRDADSGDGPMETVLLTEKEERR